MEAKFRTLSGKTIDLLNPSPEGIILDDIATALSNTCRYNGHTKRFYSVAEHCIRLSYAVTPSHAMAALLHDAAEAYVGDIIAPLKKFVKFTDSYNLIRFDKLEDDFLKVIYHALNIPEFEWKKSQYQSGPVPGMVIEADRRIVANEVEALFHVPPVLSVQPLPDVDLTKPVHLSYMERFNELFIDVQRRHN